MSQSEQDWSGLITNDKLVHKSWKARVEAYEELSKQITLLDHEDQIYEYVDKIKKFPLESNLAALEKAMECLLLFVRSCPSLATRYAHDILSGIVAKTVIGKAKVKENSLEIVMTFVEEEKHQLVMEILIGGLHAKLPKAVAATAEFIHAVLREFGAKAIDVKPIAKELASLLAHSDKSVRENAKSITLELYMWLRDGVKTYLDGVNSVTISALEKEFESMAQKPPPKAVRWLKSQKPAEEIIKKESSNENEGENGEVLDGEHQDALESENFDPYEFLDPVDIIPLMASDFYETLQEKKWSTRKECLEAFLVLCKKPKILSSPSFGEIVATLKKVISNDINVVVVTVAIECLGSLSCGLREGFSQYTNSVVQILLEKFKEKKPAFVATVHSALTSIFTNSCQNFVDLIDASLSHLSNKNPSVRQETLNFLVNCIFSKKFQAEANSPTFKPVLKRWAPEIAKKLDDAIAPVRDSAALACAAVMRIMTEKVFFTVLENIDEIKKKKILDALENWKATNQPSTPSEVKPCPIVSDKTVATSKTPSNPKFEEKNVKLSSTPVQKQRSTQTTAQKPKGLEAQFEDELKEIRECEPDISEAESKCTEWFGEELMTKLISTAWKDRLTGFEEILAKLTKQVPDLNFENGFLLIKLMLRPPGMKETNVQVLKTKITIIAEVAKSFKPLSRPAVREVITSGLLDKSIDAKLKECVTETIMCLAESTSINFVFLQIFEIIKSHKNPKIQAECINIANESILAFGLKIDLKHHVPTFLSFFDSNSPEVKKASVCLYGTLFMHLGAKARLLYDGIKPVMISAIETESERIKGQKPPAPTRGIQVSSEDDGSNREGNDDSGTQEGRNVHEFVPVEEKDDLESMIERVSISDKIPDEIFAECEDPGWKIRTAALEKVRKVLDTAKFITPDISSILSILQTKVSDSNKNIIILTLSIIEKLAECLGAHGCRQNADIVLQIVVKPLTDSMAKLRSAVISCLNKWCDVLGKNGLEVIFNLSSSPINISIENPSANSRTEMLTWLKIKLDEMSSNKLNISKDSATKLLTSFIFCSADKSPNVRKASHQAILSLFPHFGPSYKQALQMIDEIKDKTVKTLLNGLLEIPVKELTAQLAVMSAPKAQPAPKTLSRAISPAKTKFEPVELDEDSVCEKTFIASSEPDHDLSSKCENSINTTLPATPKPLPQLPISFKLGARNQRAQEYECGKVVKFTPSTALRTDCLTFTKDQASSVCSPQLFADMFSSDFKKNTQAFNVVLSIFKDGIDKTGEQPENCLNCILENADLLLKWVCIRLFDTNVPVLTKCFEFLDSYFGYYLKLMTSDPNFLANNQNNQHMCSVVEYEIGLVLPFLITKLGDSKDSIKKCAKSFIETIESLFNIPDIVFNQIIIFGLEVAKTSKIKTESFEFISQMCLRVCLDAAYRGIEPCKTIETIWNFTPTTKSRFFSEMVKSFSDSGTRNSAFNCAIQIFTIVGADTVMTYFPRMEKKINDQLLDKIKRNKNLLEERQNDLEKIFLEHKQKMQEEAQSTIVVDKSQSNANLECTFVADDGLGNESVKATEKTIETSLIFEIPQKYKLNYDGNSEPFIFPSYNIKTFDNEALKLINERNVLQEIKRNQPIIGPIPSSPSSCSDGFSLINEALGKISAFINDKLNTLADLEQFKASIESGVSQAIQFLRLSSHMSIKTSCFSRFIQNLAEVIPKFGIIWCSLPTSENANKTLELYLQILTSILFLLHSSLWTVSVVKQLDSTSWLSLINILSLMTIDAVLIVEMIHSDCNKFEQSLKNAISFQKASQSTLSHSVSICPYVHLIYQLLFRFFLSAIHDISEPVSDQCKISKVNHYRLSNATILLSKISKRLLPPFPEFLLDEERIDSSNSLIWDHLIMSFDKFLTEIDDLGVKDCGTGYRCSVDPFGQISLLENSDELHWSQIVLQFTRVIISTFSLVVRLNSIQICESMSRLAGNYLSEKTIKCLQRMLHHQDFVETTSSMIDANQIKSCLFTQLLSSTSDSVDPISHARMDLDSILKSVLSTLTSSCKLYENTSKAASISNSPYSIHLLTAMKSLLMLFLAFPFVFDRSFNQDMIPSLFRCEDKASLLEILSSICSASDWGQFKLPMPLEVSKVWEEKLKNNPQIIPEFNDRSNTQTAEYHLQKLRNFFTSKYSDLLSNMNFEGFP